MEICKKYKINTIREEYFYKSIVQNYFLKLEKTSKNVFFIEQEQ